jgi:hypothetical protein
MAHQRGLAHKNPASIISIGQISRSINLNKKKIKEANPSNAASARCSTSGTAAVYEYRVVAGLNASSSAAAQEAE